MKAVHAYVSGRVQGVGFRQSCRRTARNLHLDGWVRNLRDGRVEVWAQGSEESVDRLVDWLWSGPSAADVRGVESETVPPSQKLQDFLIQP